MLQDKNLRKIRAAKKDDHDEEPSVKKVKRDTVNIKSPVIPEKPMHGK